jgi:DNA-binding NarL/FixJ family response regulator
MSKNASVVICDDHALFRAGIKSVLAEEPTIEVVGEAENGLKAVETVLALRPSVVLMDIEMPDLSGFEATRRIKQAEESIKVLILTLYDDEQIVARCLDAGASGYVLKDVAPSQLIYAIQSVHKGERYMSPGALTRIVEHYVGRPDRARTRYDLLTDREREVLMLLAQGLSIKEVAARLGLSVKTADVHKSNLMRKLDLHNRSDLIKYAIQEKLINVPRLDLSPSGTDQE